MPKIDVLHMQNVFRKTSIIISYLDKKGKNNNDFTQNTITVWRSLTQTEKIYHSVFLLLFTIFQNAIYCVLPRKIICLAHYPKSGGCE